MAKNQTAEDSSPLNGSLTPWNHPRVIANHRARKRTDLIVRILAVACALAILIPLGDLLAIFLVQGGGALTVDRIFNNLAAPQPGLGSAIVGTALLTALSSAVAIPLGILGGVYMSDFSKGGRFSEGLRFAADVLAGVPSIVLGYSCFLVIVVYLNTGFSAVAGAIALAIIMFPYIFRTTEIAIKKVPNSIKEGAIALGSTKTTMINKLALRFALPGILTGILLSISIALSETAPLLYTAGFGFFAPTKLVHDQVGYLTGVIWQYYQSAIPEQQQLAAVATFVLIMLILAINLVARIGLSRFSKV